MWKAKPRIWKHLRFIYKQYNNSVEFGYYLMKETEHFVLLQTSVVITEEYYVMVNSEELIGTTDHMTL